MKHNLTVSQPDYYINISELDQVKHFSIVPMVFVVGGFLFVCLLLLLWGVGGGGAVI